MKLRTRYIQKASLIAIVASTLVSCGTQKAPKRYMAKTYRRLRHELKFAEVSKMHDSVKIILPDDMLFDFNSAVVKESEQYKVEQMADILNNRIQTAILINGHTDNTGSEDFNLQLSADRAENTKKVLTKNKVSADRISTWGLGKRHPIADNSTKAGRARNRRVEFILLFRPAKN